MTDQTNAAADDIINVFVDAVRNAKQELIALLHEEMASQQQDLIREIKEKLNL